MEHISTLSSPFTEPVSNVSPQAHFTIAYITIMSIPSQEQIDAAVAQIMGSMSREEMEGMLNDALAQQTGVNSQELADYISAMTDEEFNNMFTQIIAEQFSMQYADQVQEQLSAMSAQQLAAALDIALPSYTTEQLGYVDLNDPATINLYASSFENKEVIEQAIEDYNATVSELEQIEYTDYVGLMMSSVTSIINAVTYVLIAFVAVSLIVSSIMIGVITLISVQERTKEIGILRAIGASKRNVSSMFNAETVIIGFTSGALGVIITYLLCIPINIILHQLTGISSLSAYLPVSVAVILILISVALTLFSGIIPSRSAAKKDPVVALRTE